uniref:phytol kinase n=1 Tax=Tetradesmus obliquus TaxID=3088 RepID=A0A383WA14_TETOB|eukprot:jgi/Sobl393_1/8650/SZX74032.1
MQNLSAAVAWIGLQLAATQHQAPRQAAALLEQQQQLQAALGHVLAAGSSSSSSSSSWQVILGTCTTDSTTYLKLLLSLKAAVSAELAQQLAGFGAALSGRFPAKLCCNAPGCTSLDKFSELEAVGGKACMCERCRTARYCCRACQESHWKAHKAACRALAAAQAHGGAQQQ